MKESLRKENEENGALKVIAGIGLILLIGIVFLILFGRYLDSKGIGVPGSEQITKSYEVSGDANGIDSESVVNIINEVNGFNDANSHLVSDTE